MQIIVRKDKQMNFLEQLNKQIEEQTRNGRQEVYVNAEELKKLNPNIQPLGDRIYIKKEVLNELIYKYQEKQKPEFKIKKRLINVLRGQLNVVKTDSQLNEDEKFIQYDIIFKTMNFIAGYERQNNKEEQKNNTHNNNDEFER